MSSYTFEYSLLICRAVAAHLPWEFWAIFSITFRCSAQNTLSLNGLKIFGYKSPNLLRSYLL